MDLPHDLVVRGISFLNLDDCDEAEQEHLLQILYPADLQVTSSAKQVEIPEQHAEGSVYDAENSIGDLENCYSSQIRHQLSNGELVPQIIPQQQMFDHQHGLPIVSCSAMTDYQHHMATGSITTAAPVSQTSTYSAYPSSFLYVTPNMVVSQGSEEHQQRHHIIPPSQPPPSLSHSGPPPASHLPTPHFGSNGQQGAYVPPFAAQGGLNTTKAPQNFSGYPMFMPHHFSPHYNMHMINQQPGIHRPGMQMIRGQSPMYHQPPPMMHPMQIPITDPSQFTAPPPISLMADPAHIHMHQLPGHDEVSVQKDLVQTSQLVEPPSQTCITETGLPENARLTFLPNHVEHENGNSVIEFESSDVTKHHNQQPVVQHDESLTNESRKTDVDKPVSSSFQKEDDADTITENSGPKTWASLFRSEASPGINSRDNRQSQFLSDSSEKLAVSSQTKIEAAKGVALNGGIGKTESKIAMFLQTYTLNHKVQSLKPRGLSNRSNWCFVNAIMQALVACPPFFNFIKSIPTECLPDSGTEQNYNSSVKILSAVHAFVSEFSHLDNFPRLSKKDKNKKAEDFPLDKTFEATSIFQVLLNLNTETFNVVEGRQEDAEEFLTFLLNGLNDEMVSILKIANGPSIANESTTTTNTTTTNHVNEESEAEDEWQEVQRGTKNKGVVTRRGGDLGISNNIKTPISDMFQGQIRSMVSRSHGEDSATLQPFYTLQLDIQSEGIKNVSDALSHNFSTETLDGFVCSKTKKEMEASRSLQLEELPPILVLHLKRFIYDANSGGCQKLLKNIDFPVDLEIPKDILSNSKHKYGVRQRTYKLFAVVYHNGTEATKGHYVADIYHTGLSSWLHCDDSTLKSVSENMVLSLSASSIPYILFYRRGDTMGGGDKTLKPNVGNPLPSANKINSS